MDAATHYNGAPPPQSTLSSARSANAVANPDGFFPWNEPLNLPATRASVFYPTAARFPAHGTFEWRTSIITWRRPRCLQ